MISHTSPQLTAKGNIVPIGNRNKIVAAALFDRPARIQRTVARMKRGASQHGLPGRTDPSHYRREPAIRRAESLQPGLQRLRAGAIPVLMLFASSIAAQDVLPFPAPPMGGKVGPTMQESVHKWREQARHLPEDAPYILIVMLDDAGYGQAGTFGGEIETPTFSRLADEGISYNAFHTTAMCSPDDD